MDQLLAALDGAWKVLVTCLILGAGLPALYSVGLKQLALADGTIATPKRSEYPAVHKAIAYVLFAVVILAIFLGLSFIMAGGFGYVIKLDQFPPSIKHK